MKDAVSQKLAAIAAAINTEGIQTAGPLNAEIDRINDEYNRLPPAHRRGAKDAKVRLLEERHLLTKQRDANWKKSENCRQYPDL